MHHQNNAELGSYRDGLREQLLYVRCLRAGGDIEVLRFDAQELVAHTTASEIGGKSVLPQGVNNGSSLVFFYRHTGMVARR